MVFLIRFALAGDAVVVLGLDSDKWAVGRTGGLVGLESEVGRGSIFRVRLPRVGG